MTINKVDFSLEIPEMAGKLAFVCESLIDLDPDDASREMFLGLRSILGEIRDKLNEINYELYFKDEGECTPGAPCNLRT